MANYLAVFGWAVLVAGGFGFVGFPSTLRFALRNMLNLKENGVVYPLYMAPPFASDSKYMVYSVKNPREVLRGGKMKFELKGPFFYKAFIWRDNISFLKSGELLRYDSHRLLILDEQRSADLDEKFWLLNPIVAAIPGQVKEMVVDKVPFKRVVEPIVFSSVNVLLDSYGERLFIQRTARELLQGKKVELLESLYSLGDRFGLKAILPPGPPENVFGVAHFQNNTPERVTIYTGTGETVSRFGDVLQWRDMDEVVFWRGKCRKISGTNGELHKAFVDSSKPIPVFVPQFCRTFNLDPVTTNTVDVGHGVLAYEFNVSGKLFQGANSNPDNKCFCLDPQALDCKLDGFVNMGPCFFNAPLFFARPNFKGVDRRMKRLVDEETLEQENIPTQQSFYLEPITGTIVKVNLTLLGTFKVKRQAYMRDMSNIQNLTYAPLFLANESIEVPFSITWQFLFLQGLYYNYSLIFFTVAVAGVGLLALNYRKSVRVGGAPVAAPAASALAAPPAPSESAVQERRR